MADIVELSVLLEKLRGFSPLRRVLLANAGTLQGALSAYFGSPVTIEVIHQSSENGSINRVVDLVCKEFELMVCHAETQVRVTDPRIKQLMSESSIGLGQITALLGLRTTFDLEAVGDAPDDEGSFWRRYRLSGDGFDFDITELFPASLYPAGGTAPVGG